jgi:hypothetical protein
MTRRADGGEDDPALFDLPLNDEEPRPTRELGEARAPRSAPTAHPAELPPEPFLFDPAELRRTEGAGRFAPVHETAADPHAPPAARRDAAGLADGGARASAGRGIAAPAAWRHRVWAGLLDLLVHLAVLAIAIAGVRMLGIRPGLADGSAFAIVLLLASCLYYLPALACGGRTLGMARIGLVARAPDDLPLSLGQAARRWLAALFTVALLGLPVLAGLAGWWLADAMSGSRVYRREA